MQPAATERTYLKVHSPSTGDYLGSCVVDTLITVQEACEQARAALPAWRSMPMYQRCALLEAAADAAEAAAEELALLLSHESGKVLRQARMEVQFTLDLLRSTAREARFMKGSVLPMEALAGTSADFAWEQRVPLGLVGVILPFNFPLELLVEKAAAALVMGNTVVVKLPEQAPLALLRMIETFRSAGLPEEVLVPLIGGRTVGEHLVARPELDAISLTGSTAAGIAVATQSAPTLRKLHLELGGNDAAIILEDADLDLVVPQLIFGRTLMNGQACASNKRIIVHERIAAVLAEQLQEQLAKLKVGPAADPTSDVGPLISEASAERVLQQVQQAVAEGACLRHGKLQRNGCFVEPILLTDVPAEAAIAVDDEIFGPVLPIIPVASEEQAIAVANQSSYGLSGCVFSRDWQRALRVAEATRSGGCVINGTGNYRPITVPFGGVKRSGLGREGLGYTLEEMSQLRYFVLRNFRQTP